MADQNDYYDLGSFGRPVTTKSQEAQKWFDRGLTWSYAFNHQESINCFEKAIEIDPGCAMAYWGLAFALGPNYNKPWEVFDEDELKTTLTRTHDAVKQAKENAVKATLVEQALINALQFRYQQDHKPEDCSAWNHAYADAMKSAYEKFPEDLDVATIYADALMNLTPWEMWNLRTGEPLPGARSLEAKQVLDQALTQDGAYTHPGLLHMYIHLMEMSTTPEAALVAANHLRPLIPDGPHLLHMPSHIDILLGDYQRAIDSNLEAIRADQKFLTRSGQLDFYAFYVLHDYHTLIFAAMFNGRSEIALQTALELEANLPESLLRVESPPMADWLESFMSVRLHTLIRFGRWDDIINLELPQDQKLYCVRTATIHYAKGVAYAATRKVAEAEEQRALFQEAVKRVPATRLEFPNKCIDILAVAAEMLDGELEYRRGNFEVAFEHLRKAITLDDNLIYCEPWSWMLPSRHPYAALLLEQGHVEEAAAMYKADLGLDDTLPRARQHPNNVWALHGYHECLVRLGKTAEAEKMENQLKVAMEIADIPVTSSCFCRLSTAVSSTTNTRDCCSKE